MKRAALIFAALAVAFAAPAAPVRTATENFVTNKIAAAIAALPAPDYSPTNAELRATIEAVAPTPGDYETVSNRAVNAVQTTDTNWLDAESKMEAITASDDEFFPWRFLGSAFLADELVWSGDGYNYHLVYDESAMRWITWYAPPGSEDMIDEETGRFLTQKDIAYLSDIYAAATAATNYTDSAVAGKLDTEGDHYAFRNATPGLTIDSVLGSSARTYVFAKPGYEGDPDTVARLSDIPESVTPSAVTNIVRELSLGGIWDSELEVWWTPVMVGGSLTYQATTNVNLNAEN